MAIWEWTSWTSLSLSLMNFAFEINKKLSWKKIVLLSKECPQPKATAFPNYLLPAWEQLQSEGWRTQGFGPFPSQDTLELRWFQSSLTDGLRLWVHLHHSPDQLPSLIGAGNMRLPLIADCFSWGLAWAQVASRAYHHLTGFLRQADVNLLLCQRLFRYFWHHS